MRGLFLPFRHVSLIVLVELLVLSPHFLWAQRTLPLEKIPIHLLDTPAPFARVSEIQIPLTENCPCPSSEIRARPTRG